MFFATRKNSEVHEVEEFWFFSMMTTIMRGYITEDNEELRKLFRDTMEGQFEPEWCNKFFSNQLESDKTDSVQQKTEWWMVVVDSGGRIRNAVYEYICA